MSVGILDGNMLKAFLLGVSLTPAAVATITSAEQTFTVVGLIPGDFVYVAMPSLVAGIGIVNARVSAKDTLAISFVNPTAGSVTPVSGIYDVLVLRPDGPKAAALSAS